MLFQDIHPFIRFVHYLPLDKHSHYKPTIPYDARFFYCYHGNGTIFVNDTPYSMATGCTLIIPSGTKYHLVTPAQTVTYIAINFDYTLSNLDKKQPIPPASQAYYNPSKRLEHVCFQDNHFFNQVAFLENTDNFSHSLFRLEREYAQKLLHYERLCSDILSELLIECSRKLSSHQHYYNNDNIRKVIDYIHENYAQDISNKTIADVLNLHPNYVNSLIKNFTGSSLHQYVLLVRISHAIELLQEGTLSIGEVATQCGFCNIYHFSKYFKKIVGIIPSQYRNQPERNFQN